MVAFGHTAVGALVGVGMYQALGHTQPELGLILAGGGGIISHYVADFVPHGHFFKHPDFKKYIVIDIIFDLFLSIVFYLGLTFMTSGLGWKFWYVLFGIGGSQFPDFIGGLYELKILPHKGLLKIEHDFHEGTHWHGIFKNGKLIDGQPLKLYDVWQLSMVLIALVAVVSF